MAMNKKELADFESVKIQAALRWTYPVYPDIPVSKHGEETSGFDSRGYEAWSESHAHGSGKRRELKIGCASQNGIALYSRKVDALRNMRYELECKLARELRMMDARIEAEIKAE